VKKIHYNCIQNKDRKKNPSSFPKKKLQAFKKTVGVLKKNEKSLEIFLNSKSILLQNMVFQNVKLD